MHPKNIFLIALVVLFILLVPFLAMRFTGEMAWDIADFTIAGVLLFGTGISYELVTRNAATFVYRVAAGIALAAALLLVWLNLAVGIIGSEENPANRLYIVVLAILIIGALNAHFQPLGMARVLFAAALAQACVSGIALVLESSPEVLEVLILNGFFVTLWVGSALLFRRAYAIASKSSATKSENPY